MNKIIKYTFYLISLILGFIGFMFIFLGGFGDSPYHMGLGLILLCTGIALLNIEMKAL